MAMTHVDRTRSTVELQPYFESAANGACGLDGSGYVAGLRCTQGESWGACVPLDATSVEAVVLARASLTIALEVDGHLYIEPTGLDEAAIEAAIRDGNLPTVELGTLVKSTVCSDTLRMEDDPGAILACLRQQLVMALAHVDAAAAAIAK
jgi:hypothetical protein